MRKLVVTRLGDFEIVRELGRGGMGVVYEAVQTSLGRRVALKVLGPGLGLTPRAVDRFRREAAAAAKLHHTNIVPVYFTGEQDGIHFYAMELIDGPSLDAVIRQLRSQSNQPVAAIPGDLAATGPYASPDPLTTPNSFTSSGGSSADRFDRIAAMIADVADALHHAHQSGVTHRDVKPSNLMLSSDGRLSVTDFGLARMLEQPGMTVTGEFVGTPAYMSPEQITAGRVPVDHRTDVYSLGATLYELLTLRPPFAAEGRDKLLAMVIQKEPPPPRCLDPKVPRDLETICLKCLEKDPDRRYQNGKELGDDLRRFVNRFAILARRAGPLTRIKKWVRRNPALSAAALIVLLAVGAAGFFAWRAEIEKRERLEGEQRRESVALAEKRQAALDRAILAAMSGQLADADASLLEAERLGAELAERRFVAGILAQYRGDPEAAKRMLLDACSERPDWAAPRAFLSVVCNYAEDWDGEIEHGKRALQLQPVTPDDYLFRGYMIGFSNPRRGLPDVEEAIKRRRSVLAQIVLADVLTVLADDSGRVEDAVAARDALRSARSLMGDTPQLTVVALYVAIVGCNNCQLHGRSEEAKTWLAEAKNDFERAASIRAYPGTLQCRTLYLLFRDGSPDALNPENRVAGLAGSDFSSCYSYLASQLRRGRTADGLAYLDRVRPGKATRFLRVGLLVGDDPDAARAECRQARGEALDTRYRPFGPYASSLCGLSEEARQAARAFCERPLPFAEWDDKPPFLRGVVRHAFEGTTMEVEAEIGTSRWKRFLAYDTLGFAALSQGDRATAQDRFRKADDHPPVFSASYLWMQEIRRRIIHDPTWPAWLREKK
jgi:tetratricopeptide (TPR) repeat protein